MLIKILGIQKLFGKPKVPSQEEKDNVIQLCGCLLLELAQKDFPYFEMDDDAFNKILPDIKVEEMPIKFRVSYYIFEIKHTFLAHICELERDKRVIVKGYAKKSPQNEIYNLYVGTVITGEDGKLKYNLEGIIDKVDVEMPAFGTPEPIPTSGSPKN